MALGDTDTFTAADVNPASDSSMAEGGPISDVAPVTASPGQKPSSSFITAQSPPPTRRSIPEPNLDRAYHTIDFLQRNPQWLANPYTTHAANAILATSSKMIEQSIQLGRVSAMADAAAARNTLGKDVGKSLLHMAKLGGDAADIAAKWNAIGDDGKPLWQDSSNWSSIMSDYRTITKQINEKKFAPSLGEKEDDYLKRLIDSGAPPEMIQTQRNRIALHSETPEAKADTAYAAKVKTLTMAQRMKHQGELVKGIDDAEAKAVAHLRKGDEASADAERARGASFRRKLEVLNRESGQTQVVQPTTPTAPQPSAPLPMPSVKTELKTGQRYSTSRGEATWDGEKFVQ